MGLFTNPLSHAGYPPGVTGTPTTQPSEVRAATVAEANAGVLDNVYISPATQAAAVAVDFASPPALGFGSTTPRPVASTTLTSSGNTTLGTGAAATTFSLFNIAPSGARTSTYNGGNSAQNDSVTWFSGNPSANAQSFSVFAGLPSGGTQTVNFFTGNATGGTQAFNLLTGTRAGTANIGTGAAVHTVNLLASTGKLGAFGATAVVQQLQGAITNSVTVGGSTGVIADYSDLTVYANDAAAIRNDIYQLGLALSGCITALRNYGLLG